jgi:hypothetical protein
MKLNWSGRVFDYRALRLLIGLIAFILPFAVSLLSSKPLSSISASYFTKGRDAFVGMLFVVGAFFWAYHGHTSAQAYASKAASITALLVAVFPTTCPTCETTAKSVVHYIAAATLFAILSYFCLGPFREHTKRQGGKRGMRARIYLVCGYIMIACIAVIGLGEFILSDETMESLRITYWGEAIALGAFGIAWIVSGKYLRFLVDDEDALKLFTRR